MYNVEKSQNRSKELEKRGREKSVDGEIEGRGSVSKVLEMES